MEFVINDQGRGSVRATISRGRPQRIFVVEDDAATREAMVGALLDEGHEVIGVEDGAKLLECLRTIVDTGLRAPDLIAMDVRMPGRSGIAILESLRRHGWTTPIVLVTSFVSNELKFRVEVAGSADIVEKPFDPDELQSAAWRACTHSNYFEPCERAWFR